MTVHGIRTRSSASAAPAVPTSAINLATVATASSTPLGSLVGTTMLQRTTGSTWHFRGGFVPIIHVWPRPFAVAAISPPIAGTATLGFGATVPVEIVTGDVGVAVPGAQVVLDRLDDAPIGAVAEGGLAVKEQVIAMEGVQDRWSPCGARRNRDM